MPDWAIGAVFYQVFPERFRNGDPSNDPTAESLEYPRLAPENWSVTPWTSDWYARADWERASGPNFFRDGVYNRRYGGDLQGVIDKLDYLKDLGVDAIYLNPIFHARSLHKYDATSHHHIDPYFGPDPEGDLRLIADESPGSDSWVWTAADKLFLKLLAEAHARGLRVVIDGVFNHSGRDFFAFRDLEKNQQESIYKDWYVVSAFDNPITPQREFACRGWWGVSSLPEFADNAAGDNLHNGPRRYVLRATERWMDPNGDGDPSDGVDGWRLDVAPEVPNGFWRQWTKYARRINPEAYTVAENWGEASEYVRECGFSATMNYHGFAIPVKGYLVDGCLSASDAARMLTQRSEAFRLRTRHGLMSLIDSHDTERLASMIVNAATDRPYLDADRFDYDVGGRASPKHWGSYQVRKPNDRERRLQRLVAMMQAAFIGAPTIYYGTEAGMWGADDPCDRMPMVWDDLEHDDQLVDPLGRPREPDKVCFDRELHSFYSRVLEMRKNAPPLRRGDFRVVAADDAQQTLAFERSLGKDSCLVVLNRSDSPTEIALPVSEGDYRLVFSTCDDPAQSQVKTEDQCLSVELQPLEGVVLRKGSGAD